MNILTDTLPNKINGREIRTDFRVWLRVRSITEKVIPEKLLNRDYFIETMDKIGDLIFEDWPEFYTTELFNEVMAFLSCKGAEQINLEEAGKTDLKQGANIFDITFDSGAIYASFLTQYGVDLIKIKYLHWYQFNVLLQNLNDDTPLRLRTKIRAMKVSDVAKDKLKDLKRIQMFYRIPLSEVEKSAKQKLFEVLEGGQ